MRRLDIIFYKIRRELILQKPQIISRNDASALGKLWYFTGEVCANGHVAERRVKDGKCRDCRNAHKRRQETRQRLARRLSRPVETKVPVSEVRKTFAYRAARGADAGRYRRNGRKRPADGAPLLVVYVIVAGPYCKIGVTSDPEIRLKGVQCGCPLPAKLHFCTERLPRHHATWVEKTVHHSLQRLNTTNEWFEVSADEAVRAIRMAEMFA